MKYFSFISILTTVLFLPLAHGHTSSNKLTQNSIPNLGTHGLQIAEDINPDPDIVEIDLEAREDFVDIGFGVPTKVYTYNGTVPGPLIKGYVGNTLIVNFTNNLPEPTTIHWHGVRLPADMDGGIVAQIPIPPGGKFRYEFVLQEASLFWFHPHVRSNEQVEKGLAGTLIVFDKNTDHPTPDGDSDHLAEFSQHVMVLDDILTDKDGQILEAFSGSKESILLEKINGREGNTLLVNGEILPTMMVKSGETVRWRLVNIANTRFMRLEVPGHQLTRIGGDGGLLEKPISGLKDIMIVPGERADILFTPNGKPGSELLVYWKDIQRGRHTVKIEKGSVKMGDDPMDGSYPSLPIMKLVFDTATADTPKIPNKLGKIKAIDISKATTRSLMFNHTRPQANGDIFFTINGKRYDQITAADTPDAQVGDTQIWELGNMAGGDHPFHLHGFFFQVLETIQKDAAGNVINVIPAPPLENKDMVNLPARPGKMGSVTIVKIAIKFDPADGLKDSDIVANGGEIARVSANSIEGIRGRSGGWQFHCHILEHADLGMMSFVEVWN